MRNKVSSIIAFASIALYAAAIGIGVIRILAGVNERRVVAQREFYDLADIASSAGALGLEESFKDAVRDAVAASKTLQAVIITGPFGAEFTYERDNNGLIAWEGDTPRFRRSFGSFRNPHFSPLRVDGLRNATIQALSSAVDSRALSRILLQSLFMVLAATILSAATLIFYHVKGKDAALVSERMREIYPPKPGQAAAQGNPLPAQPARDNGETWLKEKLDAELGICSITNKDLALILMELSLTAGFGVDDDASVNRKVADRARQFFSAQDSVHERTGRGLAVILSGEGLEEAFSKARRFHDLIVTELPELFPHRNDLRIGISSRNKRLVRANRLFLEASQALDKANLEPQSPIVAFKSDPEKYKAFVQSRKKSSGA
jgi:GGDEF domain-containing protein